ncbi:Predicted DNA-binding protein, MmcQ/YjbR family [Chitinophaga costaii]|uniref:Predicted DNA-binding protein, MmcQ/YjbR family n=1 Tax=Chitinophaga costaii TaxID=1335309 RepID=A0A1C4BGH4_9BACT|nr:MmcQ/YjbR family DNA-binding protein [Chitinophaga costaii]PUZ27618.1 MmcQ/YjbR family DNA-binding protein [Chitinophaga costaii]SCC06006.1 Predicted DNA-binding protein, MmcQ/YjbR family [Chitinophaga costaii]
MFDLIKEYCLSLPAVAVKEKRNGGLYFSVNDRLFCILYQHLPNQVAFRCKPEVYHFLISRPAIVPAPQLARYHWVQLERADVFPFSDLAANIHAAYEMEAKAGSPQVNVLPVVPHASSTYYPTR